MSHISVLQLVWKHFPVTFENFTVIFLLIAELFQFTRIQSNHTAPTSISCWSKNIYLHWSSPEQPLRLELGPVTQADGCCLTVFCCWFLLSQFKVFPLFTPSGISPKGDRLLLPVFFFPLPVYLLLLLFGQRPMKGSFLLYFSWCWMSKGGSLRSRNILLESYFERFSPPLISFPLLWWRFRMLHQFSLKKKGRGGAAQA